MAIKPLETRFQLLANAVVISIGLYLIVTSTFYPLSFLTVFDAKRILQLALFSIIVLFAICWKPLRLQTIKQFDLLPAFSRSLLLLFFTIGIISSLRLAHPTYPLLDVAMLFLLACMTAIAAASRDLAPESFDKWAVVLIVILGFAVFIQELMGFIAGWAINFEFSYNSALIHFAHPRFYNQLQTWTIPIIAALPLMFPKKPWLKPVSIVLLGVQWFLVITLAARGTAVSLILASIFVAFWLPNSRKLWLKAHLLGLLAGIVIYSSFLFLNSIFITDSQSGAFYSNSAGRSMLHTSGRSRFWELSVKDAFNNPWLGSGPSQYACEPHNFWVPAHPHNFVMQILGEWGILAAIILLALGFIIGFKYLKALKSATPDRISEPLLKPLLAISLFAGLIHSCLSGLLVMPASQTTLILIAGWAISVSARDQAKIEFRFPLTASTTLIMSGLVAIAVLTVSWNELKHLATRTPDASSFGAMPRFWQNGRVCDFKYDAHN